MGRDLGLGLAALRDEEEAVGGEAGGREVRRLQGKGRDDLPHEENVPKKEKRQG